MILFVGDKPSANMKPDAPAFEGAACESRLKEWQRFLAPQYFPPVFKESRDKGYLVLLGMFTYNSSSSDDLRDIKAIANCKAKVIALGNSASKILTQLEIPHFKLPHPSGRNRQINDKAFINARLEACKQYIETTIKAKV